MLLLALTQCAIFLFMENNKFKVNQIVKGKVVGVFVILGFRNDLGTETHAQVKCVNPKNYSETSQGEFSLPLSALEEIEKN